MKIADIPLDNPGVLAPLANITNLPFRLLAKEAGCALVYSEMISANGLVHRSKKTLAMLATDPAERPVAMQIFGADPPVMAEAASILEEAGADICDINFGCSVKKVVKTGAGVALMREPVRAEAVLCAVRKAVSIPLAIKIRTGWDPSGAQALGLCRVAEDCGVDAVAVHPRTATQGFGGRADWSIIAAVKGQTRLPVIGNGDVTCADDALAMQRQTGCDAVMVGRAAIGDPFLFGRIRDAVAGAEPRPAAAEERIRTMARYLALSVAHTGEEHACRMMRSRLGWFVRGLPGASRFRESITRIRTEEEALALIERFARRIGVEIDLNPEVVHPEVGGGMVWAKP
ncbi:MAG: tRNA dihydrouridine synthase DusB [Desulfobacterales bacterium]|jgi:nifR3 family TIM-barrel protein